MTQGDNKESMSIRQIQTAYEMPHSDLASGTVQERIYAAMYGYLTDDLGRDREWSKVRAKAESARIPAARVCDELLQNGIVVAGKRVLDLGAGLGCLTTELASRGGCMVSIEPGEAWRKVAAAQLAELGRATGGEERVGQVLGAVGEALPFADNSFDLIVSLQVLEHVQQPTRVVHELYRVLKPGGHLYIAYENYLSFREPHYDVLWWPLLPKALGAAYLKLRGRNPRFLLESVTYTTFLAVRREMFRAGFLCMRREAMRGKVLSGEGGLKWRLLKTFSGRRDASLMKLLFAIDSSRRMFTTFTEEFLRKPESPPLRS